jgi:hypothetical protein
MAKDTRLAVPAETLAQIGQHVANFLQTVQQTKAEFLKLDLETNLHGVLLLGCILKMLQFENACAILVDLTAFELKYYDGLMSADHEGRKKIYGAWLPSSQPESNGGAAKKDVQPTVHADEEPNDVATRLRTLLVAQARLSLFILKSNAQYELLAGPLMSSYIICEGMSIAVGELHTACELALEHINANLGGKAASE